MSIGKYEREALERRRNELLRRPGSLSPFEGRELDEIIRKIGTEDKTPLGDFLKKVQP